MYDASRPTDPASVAVTLLAALTLGTLALTESFAELPAAAAAYAAAWWVLRLGRDAPTGAQETR